MSERSQEPEPHASSRARAALALAYPCAADVRRDRLLDFPRGILARTSLPLQPGEEVDVRIQVAREKAGASALGVVRWTKPADEGSTVGLEIEGIEHRDEVKLDLMLGIRSAGPGEPLPAGARVDLPALRVTMLQPDPVLRQVIANALERFAREKTGLGRLNLETVADGASFVAAVADRRPDLAVIDCDGLTDWADPLVEAVRSHEPSQHVPLIVLSEVRSPNPEDRNTVTMRKPVGMKAFLHTADLLLRS